MSAALLAGLVGSPHCIGMCGGFAAAAGGARMQLAWHMGRLSTYALLGAFAGSLGWSLPHPWLAQGLAVVMMLWFALSLAGIGTHRLPQLPALNRLAARVMQREGYLARYLFGMLTGALPCGLVYAGLGLALSAQAPAQGALTMVVFGLGTVPALALLSGAIRRLIQRHPASRMWLAGAVFGLGLLSLAIRQPQPAGADVPASTVDSAALRSR